VTIVNLLLSFSLTALYGSDTIAEKQQNYKHIQHKNYMNQLSKKEVYYPDRRFNFARHSVRPRTRRLELICQEQSQQERVFMVHFADPNHHSITLSGSGVMALSLIASSIWIADVVRFSAGRICFAAGTHVQYGRPFTGLSHYEGHKHTFDPHCRRSFFAGIVIGLRMVRTILHGMRLCLAKRHFLAQTIRRHKSRIP